MLSSLRGSLPRSQRALFTVHRHVRVVSRGMCSTDGEGDLRAVTRRTLAKAHILAVQEDLKNQSSPYIGTAEFTSLCEKHAVPEADAANLLRAMDAAGSVLVVDDKASRSLAHSLSFSPCSLTGEDSFLLVRRGRPSGLPPAVGASGGAEGPAWSNTRG
mgnify:CR=1 FL=1